MADNTAAADRGEVQVSVPDTGSGYALGGKIMLSAIVVLFAVVVFMVGFHLYARWYLLRLRRRQIERRRRRRMGRTHVVLYANNHHPIPATDRGLEAAVLNSLPVSLYSDKAEQPLLECAVCLSEFEENEVLRYLPKCNHSFHIECIDMWFHSHSTCPLCRSPVERVAQPVEVEPVVVVVAEQMENENGPEQISSSVSGMCTACQMEKVDEEGSTTSYSGVRRKVGLVGVRIEVPPRRTESGSELTLSSPASRLLSIRRILSMGRKSPAGSGGTTPNGAGTSGGAPELDLESGLGESDRVQTPR